MSSISWISSFSGIPYISKTLKIYRICKESYVDLLSDIDNNIYNNSTVAMNCQIVGMISYSEAIYKCTEKIDSDSGNDKLSSNESE